MTGTDTRLQVRAKTRNGIVIRVRVIQVSSAVSLLSRFDHKPFRSTGRLIAIEKVLVVNCDAEFRCKRLRAYAGVCSSSVRGQN
jgi:hypothetical protein